MSEADLPHDRRVRVLVRYFLQELPPEEATALEDACLADAALFRRLAQVEAALIDAYVDDRLSTERARRFEGTYLLSESRRRRVRAAWARVIVPSSTPAPPRILGRALRRLRSLLGRAHT